MITVDFKAGFAMAKSVGSIITNPALGAADRAELLSHSVEQYAKHMKVGEDRATDTMLSIAKRYEGQTGKGSAALPLTFRKALTGSDEPETDNPYQDEDGSGINPDPKLVGKETKKMRHASNHEMLKLAQAGIAEEVQKTRRNGETEHQARQRVLAQNPGLYDGLRKLAFGPENESFAKQQPKGAAAEFLSKVDEIQKAEPELTGPQAYTKAYTDPANFELKKRMLAEQRGEA